jgi:hypothetical protein
MNTPGHGWSTDYEPSLGKKLLLFEVPRGIESGCRTMGWGATRTARGEWLNFQIEILTD